MKSENKTISVVIPCFNEGGSIYENIKKIRAYLVGRFGAFEIIAVNDGSGDDTLSELKKLQQEMPLIIVDKKINEGKGRAVRDGVLRSRNDVVMFLDADLAVPIESLETFLPELDRGFDIAIASRFVPGLRLLTPILWYRKFLEKVFRLLRKIILNSAEIQDSQCGFKVFTRGAAMDIFPALTINRFAFDSEIVFIAKKRGYKIKELPIALQNPTRSSIRIIKDSANMFADLIRIRRNDFLGKYERH